MSLPPRSGPATSVPSSGYARTRSLNRHGLVNLTRSTGWFHVLVNSVTVVLDGRLVKWLEQGQPGIDFVRERSGVHHRCSLRNDRNRFGRCTRRVPGDASPTWSTASCAPLKTKRYPLCECRGAHRKPESTNAIAAYYKARSWLRESVAPFWVRSQQANGCDDRPLSLPNSLGAVIGLRLRSSARMITTLFDSESPL